MHSQSINGYRLIFKEVKTTKEDEVNTAECCRDFSSKRNSNKALFWCKKKKNPIKCHSGTKIIITLGICMAPAMHNADSIYT